MRKLSKRGLSMPSDTMIYWAIAIVVLIVFLVFAGVFWGRITNWFDYLKGLGWR